MERGRQTITYKSMNAGILFFFSFQEQSGMWARLTKLSTQANSSLRVQQVVKAITISLPRKVSSSVESWGASFVRLTRQLKEHMSVLNKSRSSSSLDKPPETPTLQGQGQPMEGQCEPWLSHKMVDISLFTPHFPASCLLQISAYGLPSNFMTIQKLSDLPIVCHL